MRRRRFVPFLFVLLLLAAACSRSPSEEALRQRIDQLQSAGEGRDVEGFVAVLAADFAGNGTEFDRRGMERMLRLVAMRHREIGVTRTSTEIEIDGERAVVRAQVLLTGGSGGILPETGRLLEIESTWRFEGGEWRVVGARWR